MKKIIYSIVLIFLTAGIVSANYENNSNLIIKSSDYSLIKVIINGRHSSWASTHKFQNLRGGHCEIKVFRQSYDPYSCSNQSYLAHLGSVHIPGKSKVIAKLNRYNRLKVVSVTPNYHKPRGQQKPRYRNNKCSSPNYSYSNSSRDNTYRNNSNNNNSSFNSYKNRNHSVNKNYNVNNGLSIEQFNYVISAMNRSPFNSEKLLIAKQSIATNGINTNQLLSVLNQLKFDVSKLELAKYAYQYTVDRANYFKISNAFIFSSSKKAFYEHIKTVKI